MECLPYTKFLGVFSLLAILVYFEHSLKLNERRVHNISNLICLVMSRPIRKIYPIRFACDISKCFCQAIR